MCVPQLGIMLNQIAKLTLVFHQESKTCVQEPSGSSCVHPTRFTPHTASSPSQVVTIVAPKRCLTERNPSLSFYLRAWFDPLCHLWRLQPPNRISSLRP